MRELPGAEFDESILRGFDEAGPPGKDAPVRGVRRRGRGVGGFVRQFGTLDLAVLHLQVRSVPKPREGKGNGAKSDGRVLVEAGVHPLLQGWEQGLHAGGGDESRHSRAGRRAKLREAAEEERSPLGRHQGAALDETLEEKVEARIVADSAQGLPGGGKTPQSGERVAQLVNGGTLRVRLYAVQQGIAITAA